MQQKKDLLTRPLKSTWANPIIQCSGNTLCAGVSSFFWPGAMRQKYILVHFLTYYIGITIKMQ